MADPRRGGQISPYTWRAACLLFEAARELDAALDDGCKNESMLWLNHENSERVYKARCRLASALYKARALGVARG